MKLASFSLIYSAFAQNSCQVKFLGHCAEYEELKLGEVLFDSKFDTSTCMEKCLATPECAAFIVRRGTCSLVKAGCSSQFNPYFQFYNLEDCFDQKAFGSLGRTFPSTSVRTTTTPTTTTSRKRFLPLSLRLLQDHKIVLKSAGMSATTEFGTIEERVNRVVEVLQRVVNSDKDSGSKFSKKITARLNSRKKFIFHRMNSKAKNCGPPIIPKVLEDDNQPIRSVCHLVKHNTDQLITILDKYNKGCIRDDDFDDRAENSLSRISNRILKKLNC